jgi:hypothetical protein
MDLTTKKKERSQCPFCFQTCSNNWNLKVHRQRKHPERGQPSGNGLHSTRTQLLPNMNNMPTNEMYYHHDHGYPKFHSSNTSSSIPQFNKTIEESRVPKKRNAQDELNQTIREAIELAKLTRPSFVQTPAIGTGVPWPFSNFSMPQQLCNNESKNIMGFQGGICENCFSPFFYVVSGKQKMIPRTQGKLAHTCDAKDVSDTKFVLDIQSEREQAHID